MYGHSTIESDLVLLESIRHHLLGESDNPLAASFSNSVNAPVYSRSSSFSSLYPCLTDNWGELPLKEDDSEDMVLYGVLRDAVNVRWVPSLGAVSSDSSSSGFASTVTVKSEPDMSPVASQECSVVSSVLPQEKTVPAAAPSKGKHYRIPEAKCDPREN